MAYLVLAYQLLVHGRRAARKRSPAVSRLYTALAVYTTVIMLGYLVFWGVNVGLRLQRLPSANVMIAGYAVLDVLLKSVVGAWIMYAYAKVLEMRDTTWLGCQECDEGRIRISDEEVEE